ncbi:hypothetical protein LSH36_311g03065, partial [Paralvinella palmiformis]
KKNKNKDRYVFVSGLIMLGLGLVGCAVSLTIYFTTRENPQPVPQMQLPKQANYTKPEKPNIIFITVQEIGWSDIRYGEPRIQVHTPNLDDLAKNGRTLENHYVQPTSVSSHHAFLTGRLPFKSGMQHGPFDVAAPYCTGSDLTLISRTLKQRGTRYDWRVDAMTNDDVPDGGTFYTELLADHVINTISTTRRPYFVNLAFGDVHKHVEIPSRYTSYYPDCDEGTNSLSCLYMGDEAERRRNLKRRNYLGFITAVDEAIGRIKRAADDNTVIIFTPDTGGSHQEYANNLPLRGATGTLYEGGTKTRAIVSSPYMEAPILNNRHEGLFHATDWAATITSLAGTFPSSQHDGFDQTEMILFGLPSKRDRIIYNLDMEQYPLLGQSAIRHNEWKLIWGFDGITNGRGCLRTPTYETDTEFLTIPLSSSDLTSLPQDEQDRIVQLLNENTWKPDNLYSGVIRLYNLKDDPNEYEDLSGDTNNVALIQELKLMLVNELKSNYDEPPQSFNQSTSHITDPVDPGWC